MYGAIKPEMSEYFLAGKNDGGALIDESEMKAKREPSAQTDLNGLDVRYTQRKRFGKQMEHLHVTALSGHCKVRSVARICLSDFHARFFVPTELSSNVAFLNTGNAFESLMIADGLRVACIYSSDKWFS